MFNVQVGQKSDTALVFEFPVLLDALSNFCLLMHQIH